MIGINRTPQIILVILTLLFSFLFLIAVATRRYKFDSTLTGVEKGYWLFELFSALLLTGIVIGTIISCWNLIPQSTPGCLPQISDYGVIGSNIDPSRYYVTPVTRYPAKTYTDAINVYKSSPNGFSTGFFSWDGVAVVILNSNAILLKTNPPPGTSWVFQDLNRVKA